MRQVSKFAALFMATAMFAACSNDDSTSNQMEKGAGTIVVNLKNGAATRATEAATGDEKAVKNLEFYVFDANGNLDAKTPYVLIPSNKLESDNTYQFQVSAGTDNQVLVVANASIGKPGDTATPAFPATATLADIQKRLSSGSFNDQNSRVVPSTGLEMSDVQTFSVAEGEIKNVTIKLNRLSSKIHAPQMNATGVAVTLDTQEDVDKAFGGNSGLTPQDQFSFSFTGYALINGVQKSDVWDDHNFSTWVEASYTNYYLTSTFDANGDFTKAYSGQNSLGSYLLNTTEAPFVYVYENSPKRVADASGQVGTIAGQVYAFIIEGTLTSGTTNSQPRYWRVNFLRADNYKIVRNAAYTITLDKITTPGYATPEEATGGNDDVIPDNDKSSVNFTIEVTDWDAMSENTQV
ncbi:MAG: fimbria major subunit [Mediterranea sp.]|jgi:hypothetical protein|nr:fimbria major subunit [Mediterranea sp.]